METSPFLGMQVVLAVVIEEATIDAEVIVRNNAS